MRFWENILFPESIDFDYGMEVNKQILIRMDGTMRSTVRHIRKKSESIICIASLFEIKDFFFESEFLVSGWAGIHNINTHNTEGVCV